MINKKIAFTGGGTAGHAMVNTILIPYLQEFNYQILYLGSHNGLEQEMMKQIPFVSYYSISTGKLRRYLSLENIKDFFRLASGFRAAFKILRRESPQLLYSGGGYVSVPAVLAAKCLRIPVLIRETDRTVGLANKICIPFAERVYYTFPDTIIKIRTRAVFHYPGVLIRPNLFQAAFSPVSLFNKKTKSGTNQKKSSKPVCLIMGGSSGARSINEIVWQGIEILTAKFNIIHICGRGNLNQEIKGSENYEQFEYVTDGIGLLLQAADVVVSRCGSNAIWELLALNKRTVCIPIGRNASRGEQYQNAEFAAANGNALILPEAKLSPSTLCNAILQALKLENTTPYKTDAVQLEENILQHVREICEIAENTNSDIYVENI